MEDFICLFPHGNPMGYEIWIAILQHCRILLYQFIIYACVSVNCGNMAQKGDLCKTEQLRCHACTLYFLPIMNNARLKDRNINIARANILLYDLNWKPHKRKAFSIETMYFLQIQYLPHRFCLFAYLGNIVNVVWYFLFCFVLMVPAARLAAELNSNFTAFSSLNHVLGCCLCTNFEMQWAQQIQSCCICLLFDFPLVKFYLCQLTFPRLNNVIKKCQINWMHIKVIYLC